MDLRSAQLEFGSWASGLSEKATIAVVILVVGSLLALAFGQLAKLFVRQRRGAGWFVANFVQLVVVLLTFFASLSVFGVASPLIGAAVTFGVALGGGADIYGGLRLLSGGAPFRLGDPIEIHGQSIVGYVVSFGLFKTTLQRADGSLVTFQNRKLADFIFVNRYPARPTPVELEAVLGRPLETVGAKVALEEVLAAIGESRAGPIRMDQESATFRVSLSAAKNSPESIIPLAFQLLSEGLATRGFKLRSLEVI